MIASLRSRQFREIGLDELDAACPGTIIVFLFNCSQVRAS